jgi:hypothetical protein
MVKNRIWRKCTIFQDQLKKNDFFFKKRRQKKVKGRVLIMRDHVHREVTDVFRPLEEADYMCQKSF